jgi:hypothetical protein
MCAKKLPERPGPRGAKDSIRFRERLDDAAGGCDAELGDKDVRVAGKICLRAKFGTGERLSDVCVTSVDVSKRPAASMLPKSLRWSAG